MNGNIQQKALGDTNGAKAELIYYEKDTWLGSLKSLEKRNDQKKIDVEIITLDHFCHTHQIFPDIIKIDTEGFEFEVLKGGFNVLKEKRPLIIFESNSEAQRDLIFDFFTELDYSLKPVSASSLNNLIKYKKSEFILSRETNFLGHP